MPIVIRQPGDMRKRAERVLEDRAKRLDDRSTAGQSRGTILRAVTSRQGKHHDSQHPQGRPHHWRVERD
ncbi:MAG: hypothetical protein ABW128_09045, partial [Rhizorhabdus sp.]